MKLLKQPTDERHPYMPQKALEIMTVSVDACSSIGMSEKMLGVISASSLVFLLNKGG